jgi:hypothetical protein
VPQPTTLPRTPPRKKDEQIKLRKTIWKEEEEKEKGGEMN